VTYGSHAGPDGPVVELLSEERDMISHVFRLEAVVRQAEAPWQSTDRSALGSADADPRLWLAVAMVAKAARLQPRLYCRGELPMTLLKAVLKALSDS
jgi:hypothetical protein